MEFGLGFKLMLFVLLTMSLYLVYKDIRMNSHVCHQLTKKSERKCMGDHFNDILLIIIFNSPLYSTIPVLYDLYSEAFSNIFFCGPEQHRTYDVYSADINKGMFAYECASRAMELYKNHKGYLIINDDLILNFWNLVDLDKDKMWEGPKAPITVDQYEAPKKWYWWESRWGMKNCQRAFNEVHALRNESSEERAIADSLITNLENNGNGKRHCHRGRSDIFYIPQSYAVQYQMLSSIFRKHQVFLEITVPTIMRLLGNEADFETLNGIYLPGKKGQGPARDSSYFWTYYNEELVFLHPLKLHYSSYKEMNLQMLQNWVKKTGQRWTACRQ